jgi:hypothetical protein
MERNQIPQKYLNILDELSTNDETDDIINNAVTNNETWEGVQVEIYNGMDNLINESRRIQQTLCK